MTESHKTRENLSAYLDGELSEADRARVEEAAKQDPAMAAELDALRKTRELVRGLPRGHASDDFVANVLAGAERLRLVSGHAHGGAEHPLGWVRYLATAAVLLIAAGVGVVVTVLLWTTSSVDMHQPGKPAPMEVAARAPVVDDENGSRLAGVDADATHEGMESGDRVRSIGEPKERTRMNKSGGRGRTSSGMVAKGGPVGAGKGGEGYAFDYDADRPEVVEVMYVDNLDAAAGEVSRLLASNRADARVLSRKTLPDGRQQVAIEADVPAERVARVQLALADVRRQQAGEIYIATNSVNSLARRSESGKSDAFERRVAPAAPAAAAAPRPMAKVADRSKVVAAAASKASEMEEAPAAPARAADGKAEEPGLAAKNKEQVPASSVAGILPARPEAVSASELAANAGGTPASRATTRHSQSLALDGACTYSGGIIVGERLSGTQPAVADAVTPGGGNAGGMQAGSGSQTAVDAGQLDKLTVTVADGAQYSGYNDATTINGGTLRLARDTIVSNSTGATVVNNGGIVLSYGAKSDMDNLAAFSSSPYAVASVLYDPLLVACQQGTYLGRNVLLPQPAQSQGIAGGRLAKSGAGELTLGDRTVNSLQGQSVEFSGSALAGRATTQPVQSQMNQQAIINGAVCNTLNATRADSPGPTPLGSNVTNLGANTNVQQYQSVNAHGGAAAFRESQAIRSLTASGAATSPATMPAMARQYQVQQARPLTVNQAAGSQRGSQRMLVLLNGKAGIRQAEIPHAELNRLAPASRPVASPAISPTNAK